MVNGQVGPHTRAGADASGWLWEVQRDGEPKRVLVEVSGTARAVAEHTLPDETREAIRTQGESEVRKVLEMEEPPRIVKCGTAGCSHVFEGDLTEQDN
jgi:hypothetical protein